MLNPPTTAVALAAAFLGAALPGLAGLERNSGCAPSPEKGWVEFIDQTGRFCFWYPPGYKRGAASLNVDWPKDRQTLATLVSSESRRAASDDKEPATVRIYLLPGPFDLKRLVMDAPTGYDTPPTAKHFGPNVFYYYGAGGGGVAYPDMFYLNLHGRALQIVFDGPYPGDDKSPNAEMQATEKVLLSSFRAAPR